MITTAFIQESYNGKSTAVMTLAYVFARFYGKRVLVIDADDQHTTVSRIPTKRPVSKTLEAVFTESDTTVADVAEGTVWEGVDLVAGTHGLSTVTAGLEDCPDGHFVLRNKIRGADYDLCLIDTSPDWNMLTVNTICASDGIIIPVSCSNDSMRELEKTVGRYRKVRNERRHNLALYAIAVVNNDGVSRTVTDVQEKVQQRYPNELCAARVLHHRAVQQAELAKQSLFDYSPRCRAANQYLVLALELLRRVVQ